MLWWLLSLLPLLLLLLWFHLECSCCHFSGQWQWEETKRALLVDEVLKESYLQQPGLSTWLGYSVP